MPSQTRIVAPGPDPRSVRTVDGQILRPPTDWVCVPPGDPGLTRRVKASGPTWTVQEKKGRKTFSHGVWASAAAVETIRAALTTERSTPAYAKKQESAARRRDEHQAAYVETFRDSVLRYLAFHSQYADLSHRLADAVTAHATPVGSGTVARTERIPVEQRAEAAVIAWMRHQTTAYDHMTFARVKGQRREVRRMLAARSKVLLDAYRAGRPTDPATCPLQKAFARPLAG
ncbi:MAG TPA: DUF2293 domain-containing protein [Tepidisphaeraceae bacterium]|jgi:hypothetical protein|nr:DUF2293 domain-containing protein [Tepidisphaeraceae bacterium]